MIYSNFLNKHPFLDNIISYFLNLFFFLAIKFCSRKGERKLVIAVSIHKIGDSVFTIPAIKALKEYYNSNLVIVCLPEAKIIYKQVFNDLTIISLDVKNPFIANRIATGKARKIIKLLKPDKIIDLTGNVKSATLIFNSCAHEIIGFNDKYFKNIYTKFRIQRKQPKLLNIYTDVVKEVIPLEKNIVEMKYEIKNTNSRLILLHPFAGWDAKEWNFEKFVELFLMLKRNFTCKMIMEESSVDENKITFLKNNKIDFEFTNTFEKLIETIKGCGLFIGNDTGPLYIASIFGIPTFTIYGPTNPVYSKPLGNYHRIVQKKIKCTPGTNEKFCYTDGGRNCPSYECMNLLQTEEVYKEVYDLLKDLNFTV